jgi:DNA-binding response OmpR family regulator
MYRILIVEDDDTIASIMRDKLDKWGCEALIASDFKDVFNDFLNARPHLVLMDINLPYYDGFYWCSKIRQVSRVPVLFISSRDSDRAGTTTWRNLFRWTCLLPRYRQCCAGLIHTGIRI